MMLLNLQKQKILEFQLYIRKSGVEPKPAKMKVSGIPTSHRKVWRFTLTWKNKYSLEFYLEVGKSDDEPKPAKMKDYEIPIFYVRESDNAPQFAKKNWFLEFQLHVGKSGDPPQPAKMNNSWIPASNRRVWWCTSTCKSKGFWNFNFMSESLEIHLNLQKWTILEFQLPIGESDAAPQAAKMKDCEISTTCRKVWRCTSTLKNEDLWISNLM